MKGVRAMLKILKYKLGVTDVQNIFMAGQKS